MKVYLDGDEFWPHYSVRPASETDSASGHVAWYGGYTSGLVEVDEATYDRWVAAIALCEQAQAEMDKALRMAKGQR
jgi:hypothetical protein